MNYSRGFDFMLLLSTIAYVWLGLATQVYWKKSLARDLFDYDEASANLTLPLARLLGGLYLALALIYIYSYIGESIPITIKSLLFIGQLITAILGGKFVSKKLFIIQGSPAILGIVLLWLHGAFDFY